MISTPTDPLHEIHGVFGGFVRTLLGKRRMLLHQDGEERLLKVPKELRHLLQERLRKGQEVTVWGAEEVEKRSGDLLFVVAKVQPASTGEIVAGEPAACFVCPIRVCAKKNCWRSGGEELYTALQGALAQRGLTGVVEVQEVSCLDRCKTAPNADWNDHEYSRCRPREADWIVEEIAKKLR